MIEESLECLNQLGKLRDILGKALETGDEVMFDNYVQVTNFLIALDHAAYFIVQWQEEHGYIKL